MEEDENKKRNGTPPPGNLVAVVTAWSGEDLLVQGVTVTI
jgi:hypothetical protein